ncbi:MAG: ATP-grasp domain-containing protein [Ignavibacteriae bacterium]|nr:ATP-grasp domain-containing protein [Ignavibacteriota bacterium]
MPRALLLIPTTSYRAQAFLEAARRLSVEITVGSDEPNVLSASNPSGYLMISKVDISETITAVRQFHQNYLLDAIIGVDDQSVVLAARISEALSLPHNSVASVSAARNKHIMRERFKQAGVPQPLYDLFSIDNDLNVIAARITYPCVVKPLTLSASRGVIRANNEAEFIAAFQRVMKIVQMPDIAKDDSMQKLLVEEYISGTEVAVEGLLSKGKLRVLAIFDKPDSLEGPFFEETIYVTPSRLPMDNQRKIAVCVQQATKALGLEEGPIHAELRINEQGFWVLEIAARSIGGYCSRSIRCTNGREQVSLEELILRQALGMETYSFQREPQAAGVMMMPIPRAGVLQEVNGLQSAKGVSHIEDVIISIPIGQQVVPLPEGSRYLGFIFARAHRPNDVEKALREAHAQLQFEVK